MSVHYCTLGFYGKPPMGNVPSFDGEVLTIEAAQETVRNIEQRQQSGDWIVETPYGPCKHVEVSLSGGRILWTLEEVGQA